MKIRTGTKYEESIAVKREWIHPWRESVEKGNSGTVYYDIAIMELGMKHFLENEICKQIGFYQKVRDSIIKPVNTYINIPI